MPSTSLEEIARVWPFGAVLAVLAVLCIVMYWKLARPELERRSSERKADREARTAEMQTNLNVAIVHRDSAASLATTSDNLRDLAKDLTKAMEFQAESRKLDIERENRPHCDEG